MMSLFNGKTLEVMVFINKETDFNAVDSVLSYAVRGMIKRGYSENSERYYKFNVYPSQVESFLFDCKNNKIQVRILD